MLSDENQLRDPYDSIHTNGWREFMWVLVLTCVASTILFTVYEQTLLPKWLMIGLTLIVAVTLGLGARRLVKGPKPKGQDEIAFEMQARMEAEKEEKIRQARKSGEFDRWKK
ncbi:MAG: hypothetical protein ACPGVN_03150 [Alphaproteobacteria bacterium]